MLDPAKPSQTKFDLLNLLNCTKTKLLAIKVISKHEINSYQKNLINWRILQACGACFLLKNILVTKARDIIFSACCTFRVQHPSIHVGLTGRKHLPYKGGNCMKELAFQLFVNYFWERMILLVVSCC